jgi:hypothetical protein
LRPSVLSFGKPPVVGLSSIDTGTGSCGRRYLFKLSKDWPSKAAGA